MREEAKMKYKHKGQELSRKEQVMSRKILLMGGIIFFTVWVIWSYKSNITAMPNFARNTGMDCTGCHTVIPKLNQVGFRYRAAGFRLPADIGQPMDFKGLDKLYDFRIQGRVDFKRTITGSSSANQFQLTNHEITFYPITGALTPNLSSEVEVSIEPGGSPEFENAYGRWVTGKENSFFSARLGIFHPWEGYGASDRPVSLSRPLIQTSTANHNQNTFFKLWGFDQSGLEVAYNLEKTTFAATVFNGFFFEDNAIEPAQGGELKKSSSLKSFNTKDFQLAVNQLLTEDGGGVSVTYYRGTLDLPIDTINFFQNNFHRGAIYGAYPVTKKIHLLAGGELGIDQYYDLSNGSTNKRFASKGGFGEVDFFAHKNATLAGRFDWFDPSDRRKDNEVWAATTAINNPWNNGLQFIFEYQYKFTNRGASPDRKEHLAQLRAIVIF